MVNNNSASFASTAVNGDIELLTGSQATATDLGQINTVEIRAYAYQENGADGQILLRPVFSGSSDGTNHSFTPNENSGSAAWSTYQDITTDTNAPTTWTWTDVANLDVDVEFTQGASGTNTAYVSMVQVRVSYEDNTVISYAELYNRTEGAVVATLSTSNNDYERVRSAALSSNWDTINDDEYEVRVYTSNASNYADLSSAKIIIDQTDAEALRRVELVHQQINTARVQFNTLYTQDTYITQYYPYNYRDSNSFKVYVDATMRTTGGIGYVALWNDTDNDTIGTATPSEITTTSTTYERERSANVSFNTDWPADTVEFTPILKASPGETTYVSSSNLIIQVRAIDPSMSFTIAGVATDQTHNGVTTTIDSTVTTLPFGNLSVASPEYAAHSLNVVTNAASTGYTVSVQLASPLQGGYPANNIDAFAANSATWELPQTWATPTGTTPNINTGWIGANTTDTDVTGWSSGTSGKFGPISDTPVQVMKGLLPEADDTEYVSYGIEINIYQPADTYYTNLIYYVLPSY